VFELSVNLTDLSNALLSDQSVPAICETFKFEIIKHRSLKHLVEVQAKNIDIIIFDQSEYLTNSTIAEIRQHDCRWVSIYWDGLSQTGMCRTSDYLDFIIYVAIIDGELTLTWRPDKLVSTMPQIKPWRIAVELSGASGVAADHYVEGINVLLPGVALQVNNGAIKSVVSKRHLEFKRAELVGNADLSVAVTAMLASVISRYPDTTHLLEFSGGMDSSVIGVAARQADTGRRSLSYGLIQLHDAGRQQRARRDEYLRSFGYDDTAIDIELACDPFADSERTWPRVGGLQPMICPYVGGTLTYLAGLPEKVRSNNLLLLTGFGGDEALYEPRSVTVASATPPHPFIRLDTDAPDVPQATPLGSRSSFLSAASAARTCFAFDVLPVHPFCNKDVFAALQLLPPSARANKAVFRNLLKNAGLSDRYVYPFLDETFFAIFELSKNRFDFARFFSGEVILADLGVINVDKTLKYAREPLADNSVALSLLRVVRAESWLRRLSKGM
jgi:hypothetical protein